MSRKHFQLLADEIAQIVDLAQRTAAAIAVANACAQANPRFDRDRFMTACRVQ